MVRHAPVVAPSVAVEVAAWGPAVVAVRVAASVPPRRHRLPDGMSVGSDGQAGCPSPTCSAGRPRPSFGRAICLGSPRERSVVRSPYLRRGLGATGVSDPNRRWCGASRGGGRNRDTHPHHRGRRYSLAARTQGLGSPSLLPSAADDVVRSDTGRRGAFCLPADPNSIRGIPQPSPANGGGEDPTGHRHRSPLDVRDLRTLTRRLRSASPGLRPSRTPPYGRDTGPDR